MLALNFSLQFPLSYLYLVSELDYEYATKNCVSILHFEILVFISFNKLVSSELYIFNIISMYKLENFYF